MKIGFKSNRWTVVSYAEKRGPHHYWLCRCDCGTERIVQERSVWAGTSKSCGCLRREVNREIHTTHGACGHPAYQSWTAMRRRCADPSFEGYKDYGARGIAVCDRWAASFSDFWADIGAAWFEGASIDRMNVDGNYEPSNCRWATDTEQANNKRNNVRISTPWGELTKSEAARRSGLSRSALKHRIERGWAPSRLFEPMRSP